MIEEIIKSLPPEAKLDVEDQDDTSTRMGYQNIRSSGPSTLSGRL